MSWLKSPLVQITGLALALTVLLPLAVASGMDRAGPEANLFWAIAVRAVPLTLVLWIAADMREHHRTPPFDLPFLLLLAFSVSLFWYCAWTRGWHGLLLACGPGVTRARASYNGNRDQQWLRHWALDTCHDTLPERS